MNLLVLKMLHAKIQYIQAGGGLVEIRLVEKFTPNRQTDGRQTLLHAISQVTCHKPGELTIKPFYRMSIIHSLFVIKEHI